MGKKEEPKPLPPVHPVLHGLFGGTAGALGVCIVQPMDMIKTRMQLMGQQKKKGNVFQVATGIINNEGFFGLWHGVSCSILRQYTYGLTRFYIFYNVFEAFKTHYGYPPRAHEKIALGTFSGAVGGFCGNPAEVGLIRMTAEGSLPPEKRKHYTSVFNAIFRIVREEGLTTLFSGVQATMTRCAIVSAAELGSYTHAREMFLPYLGEGVHLHFCSSMVAGIFATTASLPADIVKTRVQNSPGGRASQIGVLKDILKKEGAFKLWAGFLPTYMKLGPHSVLQFVIFEQFYILYWKIVGLPDEKHII